MELDANNENVFRISFRERTKAVGGNRFERISYWEQLKWTRPFMRLAPLLGKLVHSLLVVSTSPDICGQNKVRLRRRFLVIIPE